MILPQSTPTANPLNVLLAPGGYLHEGTSDTQVFGFTESQSRSGDPNIDTDVKDFDFENDFDSSCGYSQGDPANPFDSASPQYPAAQAYLERCTSLPPSPPKHRPVASQTEAKKPTTHPLINGARDDASKAAHLARLATLLSGSQFADGEPPTELPMLKQFGGAWIAQRIGSPETIQEQTEYEKEFLRRFCDECWRSSPPDLQEFRSAFRVRPNAFQSESLVLFRKLVGHLPLLVHTVMDPARAETMSQILESMGCIVHGLQLLARVQSRALDIEPVD
ncbi:hypothetical protein C8F04DRAFT_1191409 [Mycena alexandri]|uniref:Uncharacterized protein n=1 Tax=Mycena alexandri TaxID=1745969 RepID=A0AAD6SD95_9AGAR|nr:hypothetical protein C8F04DRAFT_1191409 [Mycena alexandri]